MKIRFLQIALFMIILHSPVSSGQEATTPSLVEILDRHDTQLNAITSLEVSYKTTYRNTSDGSSNVESIRTWIAPNFEASTMQGTDQSDIVHNWWDHSTFGRLIGLDPRDPKLSARSIAEARGLLYHEDMPMHRLFAWRALQSYRLFASDNDTSLRELCEQSPERPTLQWQGDRVVIRLGHSGAKTEGLPGVPVGTPILIELDPQHGYLITRHTTTVKTDELNFTQTMEARGLTEVADGLFLPERVHYTASSGDTTMMEQSIEFSYSRVNEPVDTSRLMFVPHLLVSEFRTYGEDPSGFYVVGEDGALGKRYSEEETAIVIRNHRLGIGPNVSSNTGRNRSMAIIAFALIGICITGLLIMRRAPRTTYVIPVSMFAIGLAIAMFTQAEPNSLETKLAKLASVPKTGDIAEPITGMNLFNNTDEEIRFPGLVTVVEFWATWCGPCQPAMQKLNEVAKRQEEAWAGKVRIVSVSVDDDPKAAMKHLQSRGWTNTQAIVDEPLTDKENQSIGFPMQTSNRYGVAGVPTCILIDSQGRIVYRGHPKDIDIEVEIERLLAAEQ